LSSLFFCITMSTHDIYTLSLHDALPILSICWTFPRSNSRDIVLTLRSILRPISLKDRPSSIYAAICPLSISVKCVNVRSFVLEWVLVIVNYLRIFSVLVDLNYTRFHDDFLFIQQLHLIIQ